MTEIPIINGLGYFDWFRSGTDGFFKYAQYSFNGKRLPKDMVLRFGLTFFKPLKMVYLIEESGKLGVKIQTQPCQLFRLAGGRIKISFNPNQNYSKLPEIFHKFLEILKDALKAKEIHYYVEEKNPEYIMILAVIPRHSFKFPSTFVFRLVDKINSQIH